MSFNVCDFQNHRRMESGLFLIELFTIPQDACGSGKINWQQAGEITKMQLMNKFGAAVEFRHIEFMSPDWFLHDSSQIILESGNVNFPFVLMNGELITSDKKINISKIIKAIQSQLKQ